jgi:transposase-like protein
MAATAKEVSVSALAGAKRGSGRLKRREWPKALNRRIVAETLEPGASVSIMARRHDVTANEVFKWRREMAAEELPAEAASIGSVTMLPVEIVGAKRGGPL